MPVNGNNTSHDLLKRHIDVGRVLCARLKKRHLLLSAPRPRLGRVDPATRDVDLVAENDKWERFRVAEISVVQELILPHEQIAEALVVVDGEREQATIGAAVEGRPQAAESLLSGRVPDLKRERLATDDDVFVQELHADRVVQLRVELVTDEPVHQRTLSDAPVA